jgi:chromosome segregation ATPase
MQQAIQLPKSLRHFTKHLFLISKTYAEREKAREDVYGYLQKMRKLIIRMSLGYSDVDRLKQKIDNLINWERKYAKYFRSEDDEKQELKNHIIALEEELGREREEKSRVISEHEERLRELKESLESAKHKLRSLLLDKAKRHHRLKILEEKISQKVDSRGYFKA